MTDIVPQRLEGPTAYLIPRSTPPRVEEGKRRDFWSVVRRHMGLVLGCLTVVLIVAAVVTVVMRPTYNAVATVRIDQKPATMPVMDVLSELAMSDVSTEMQVLESRSLAQQVTDSLGLQLRLSEPKRMLRSSVFTDIRVNHPKEIAAPAPSPPLTLAAVFSKVRAIFLGSAYRLQQIPDGRFVLLDRGAGKSLGTFKAGDRITINDVSFVFAPKDTSVDTYDFDVMTLADAVDAVQSTLSVSRPDQTAGVLQVEYKDSDPQLASAVPNALTSHFVAWRLNWQRSQTKGTVTFLQNQIDTLRKALAAREDSLRSYREREGNVNLPVEASTSVERLAELQAQRNQLESERSALAKLLDDVNAKAAQRSAGEMSPYRYLVAFPTLLRNDAASGLLASLAATEDRRAELLSRRTPDDPDVRVLTTRVNQIEEQLAGIATTYLRGLTGQIAAVDQEIQQSRARASSIPRRELYQARLEREPRVLDSLYTLLQTRLKEAEIAQSVGDPAVRIVDVAEIPQDPVRPNVPLNMVLATLTGLLLGIGAAFAREYSDKTVHTRMEVQAATGLPVLGLIPRIRRASDWVAPLRDAARAARRLSPGFGPLRLEDDISNGNGVAGSHSNLPTPLRTGVDVLHIAEAYNRLAINLAFANPESTVKTIVVTSPLPGDGKTTVAVNLAVTLAQRGRSVLLVDADLRRGKIHTLLQSPREPGLSEVLLGTVPFSAAVRRIEVGDSGVLHFLTTGKLPPNTAQLHSSTQARKLLDWLKNEYDLIVLDSPPLNVVSDAALLSTNSDGVVIVARAGVTAAGALGFAMEQLQNVRARVLGTVLNDISFKRDVHYDASYEYYGQDVEYYTESRP